MQHNNTRLIIIEAAALLLLFIPVVAMQFSTEIRWGIFDFVLMAALLLGTGLVCEIILRKVHSVWGRVVGCCITLLILLLVWAELAVGILGTPLGGK